jgi:hypothetical protein
MVVDDATTNEYRLRLQTLRDEIDGITGGAVGGSRRVGPGQGGTGRLGGTSRMGERDHE